LTFEAEDRGTRDHTDMDAIAIEYIAVHDRPPIEVPHAKGCACWAAIARQIALGLFPLRLLGRLLARILREDMQVVSIMARIASGRVRFRECADHGERAEVNGRDENRPLGLTGPKMMDEQISEQSAYRCKC
jgi:hypothetical protein